MKLQTQTMRAASRDPSPRARRVLTSIPHNLTLNHNLNPSHNLTLNLILPDPHPHEESLAHPAILPPRILSKTCQNLPKPAIFSCDNRYNRYKRFLMAKGLSAYRTGRDEINNGAERYNQLS